MNNTAGGLMRKILEYIVPETTEKTLELLSKLDDYKIIAGGSKINQEKTGEYGLIDIRDCGLNYIRKLDGMLHIGAMTKISELLDSDDFCGLGQCFVKALKSTGHAIVRNQITLGGSVCALNPWFNLATLLLLSDAKLLYIDKNGENTISFRDYCKNLPRNFIKGKLLKEIIISIKKYNFNYTRFSQTEVDYAPLYVASDVVLSGNNIESAKIAISGCLSEPDFFEDIGLSGVEANRENIEKHVINYMIV